MRDILRSDIMLYYFCSIYGELSFDKIMQNELFIYSKHVFWGEKCL